MSGVCGHAQRLQEEPGICRCVGLGVASSRFRDPPPLAGRTSVAASEVLQLLGLSFLDDVCVNLTLSSRSKSSGYSLQVCEGQARARRKLVASWGNWYYCRCYCYKVLIEINCKASVFVSTSIPISGIHSIIHNGERTKIMCTCGM